MRPRTRYLVIAILAILVALLALGALPGLLKSGDPYYLTATPQGTYDATNDTLAGTNQSAVNATTLSAQRFPYATAAVANASADDSGRSEPYWEGYVGLKEAFTHSPFDEREALQRQHADATTDEGVFVHDGETVYLLTITQENA